MEEQVSKREQRQQKKEQQRQERVTRAKKAKQKKTIMWLVIAGLVVLGIWGLTRLGGDAPQGDQVTSVTESDWVKGGEDARVTLIEFGDFECPACGAFYPVGKQIEETFGDQIQMVYRHLPLTAIHPNAMPAAIASEAAGAQGAFWEMHDVLFERQAEWARQHDPRATFVQYAEALGLNVAVFEEDYDDEIGLEKIQNDIRNSRQLGVTGTPTFVLNGQVIRTPTSAQSFIDLIQSELDSTPLATNPAEPEAVHEHADFAVYLDGQQVDFSLDKYQSSDEAPLHDYTHLHDGVGTIIHKHLTGITLGEFFESIGMSLTRACFTTDDGTQYCGTNTKSLKFFVNGSPHSGFGDYELNDLDQILISYGPLEEPDLDAQLASVTDEACIYSEVCPERGTPPDESCVGGLGSNCEVGDHTHE